MKILKKTIIYLSIVIAFILSIIFGGKYINILAYSNINTIGSFPLQLDIDNYNNYNIIKPNAINRDFKMFFNNVSNYEINEYGFNIITSDNNINYSVGTYFNIASMGAVEGEVYTLSFKIIKNDYFEWFKVGNELTGEFISCFQNEICNYTTKVQDVYNYVIYGQDGNINNIYNSFGISELMLYEGDYDPNKSFAPYFEFGYNVGYGFELYNNTNTSQTTEIQLRDENNNILLNNSVTLAANSNTYYVSNNYIYIPFNIGSNGSFTFNKTFNVYFTNTNIVASTSMTNNNVNGIFFVLTYNAYYKGEYTTKLHFKNNYLLNNIAMVGVNLSLINNITNNADNLGAGITLTKTKYDDYFTCTGTNNAGELTESPICNVATNKIIETNYYNSIDISYFSNNNNAIETYAFIIEGFFENMDYFINTYFNVNITSFNARVVGNSEISPPTNDDSNYSNKYAKCNAWYDIPCQLGNAITYVIYEAPIISPIVNFVMSFINVIDYVIVYIKWFEGLGVIFSLFIFILLIRLLIMTVKGSNDDRGEK